MAKHQIVMTFRRREQKITYERFHKSLMDMYDTLKAVEREGNKTAVLVRDCADADMCHAFELAFRRLLRVAERSRNILDRLHAPIE